MSWDFTDAALKMGSITEGVAVDQYSSWSTSLLYTDIANNRILIYDDGIEDEWEGVPSTLNVWCENTEGTNGLNFDVEGRLFGCSGNGRKIVRFDKDDSYNVTMVTIADRLDGRRLNSPNDLAITPSGSIYFSDRVGDVNPDVGINFSAIISAEPQEDGTYKTVRRTFDSTMPNGLLFSRDYKTLYVAQSDYRADEKRELRAYPVNDDGSLGEFEVLHDFGPHRGIDGMTLSSEGNIVACTGWEISGPGGMITVFDPKGRIIETHPTPALRPTNCAFAGKDLYVTSIEGHLLVAKTEMTGYLLFPEPEESESHPAPEESESHPDGERRRVRF